MGEESPVERVLREAGATSEGQGSEAVGSEAVGPAVALGAPWGAPRGAAWVARTGRAVAAMAREPTETAGQEARTGRG